jgi:hypothetical protein
MPLKEGSGKFGRRFILSPSDKIFRTGDTYHIPFFSAFFFLYHLHCFYIAIIIVVIVIIVVTSVVVVGCAVWLVPI